ncbi:MAG TPA: RDD family protein [Solirubrobacteraceae bacterium]|nr:RDD family protein [Solirubrobacteraceae bacterium]
MTDASRADSGYAGLVTRAVALLIDAALIDAIALVVGAALNIIVSALGGSGNLNLLGALAGGFAWLLWSGAYFVTFWTVTGQTPGDRMMRIRVVGPGPKIGFVRAVRRFVGLVLCTITLGAGFIPVLFDDQRRGLHDRLAGTVVRWDDASRDSAVAVPAAEAAGGSAGGSAPTPGSDPGSASPTTAVRTAG